MYDLSQLFHGKIERFKLARAIGGQCNTINKSKFSNRISFLQTYDHCVVIPYPHLNLINFIGMGQKNEYVVWRAKNGFFTALDKRNQLHTWSMLSGKMLYNEHPTFDDRAFQNYEVYQADENDITYTQNFYHEKDFSLNLLKSKKSLNLEMIDENLDLTEIDKDFGVSF